MRVSSFITRESGLEGWPDAVVVTPVGGWPEDYEFTMEFAPIADTSGEHSIVVTAVELAHAGAFREYLWFLRALLARLGRPELGDFELRYGPVAVLVTQACTAELAGLLIDEAMYRIGEEGFIAGWSFAVNCTDALS